MQRMLKHSGPKFRKGNHQVVVVCSPAKESGFPSCFPIFVTSLFGRQCISGEFGLIKQGEQSQGMPAGFPKCLEPKRLEVRGKRLPHSTKVTGEHLLVGTEATS